MKKYIYTSLMLSSLLVGCSNDDSDQQYTTEVFMTGAALNAAVTLNFSPNGDMHVIDAFSNRFLKIDPNNGDILESIPNTTGSDLDFANDGTMYWVDAFVGKIFKKTTAGDISLIAELNTVIDGIAVNDAGRVFTASFLAGEDALWEVDPEGIQEPRLVVALGGFDAFDFGPDGYLYAPDYVNGTGQIYKIDVDTGDVSVISDGFCKPIATKVNSLGELYVLDSGCPQMVKVDISTGEKTVMADNLVGGPDNFDFNANNELFVAFNADAYIGKILADGSVQAITPSGLSTPGTFSIRPDGSLLIADLFSLRRFNLNTGELLESYYMDTGLIPPLTHYDDGNQIIISCFMCNSVQVWDINQKAPVETYANLQVPLNAIRFRGEIIVAEMGSGSVFQLSDKTTLISGLQGPAGLVAQGDDLYVSDAITGTIWKAVEAGVPLNPPQAIIEGLAHPEGFAFDNEGGVLVVEVGNKRLIRVDLASQDITVLADNLDMGLPISEGAAPTGGALSSVLILDPNTYYVSAEVGNVIYKVTRH